MAPTVTNWTSDNNQFSLIFEENPLADFVELPDDGRAQDELWFSNILCGVLRGSLEMVFFFFLPCSSLSFPLFPQPNRSKSSGILCAGPDRWPGIQVQMQIEAHFVSDVLRGDDTTEMRVSLVRYIEDEMPPEEEWDSPRASLGVSVGYDG